MAEVKVKVGVRAEVDYGAAVYMVGNCPQLGQWKAQAAVQLHQHQQEPGCDAKTLWGNIVLLPRNTTLSFRFFIAKVTHAGGAKVVEVILWETNIQPRQTFIPDADECELPEADFGSYDGSHTISQGWLENQTSTQVRFHDNPVFMWKPRHRNQRFTIKCSPLNFEPSNNLNQEEPKPLPQPQTGCVYSKDDYLVFMARGFNQRHLGFQIDFFVLENSDLPRFIGTAHLLPIRVCTSVYCKRVPIIGLNHRPIGEVQVEILHITPLPSYDWKMDVSYQNHWKWRKNGTTLNVGHRGMGSSYKKVAIVKENTICSLYSAAEHGADFVELDVLLTKDLIPVIYHDFSICLSTTKKNDDKELLEIPIKDLSIAHLQSMKLFHSSSDQTVGFVEVSEEVTEEDRQPFPTLQRCLELVDKHVGFNIELKYPQLFQTGDSEMVNYFDLNSYIDRILDVVLTYADDRKVIFSSFHADSCIMMNLKQNKYPVLFLSNGPTKRYTPYSDWRCTTFQHGISFAKAEGLLGVNFQAEGLLQDLSLVPYIQSMGLVLFVWGEDLNDQRVKETLRRCNVDAIIFDRMSRQHSESFTLEKTPSLQKLIEEAQAAELLSNAAGENSVYSAFQAEPQTFNMD